MSNEVEAKLPVDSFDPLRDALKSAEAAFLGRVLQTDTYYDTPENEMAGSDRGLRIRRLELLEPGRDDWDLRPQLTYKGPRDTKAEFKTRREVETHFEDASVLDEVLGVCGMRASMVIQKRRSSYRMNDCKIELDELPFIGRFVEIEGPDEKSIQSVLDALGLEGQPIHDSYLLMADAAGRRRGLQSGKITFQAESQQG